ncbi:MAG: hypothetical protein WAX77_15700 [Methylococcaceae bacterium]
MFENKKINRITEQDFNKIIEQAGGRRFSLDDSRESEKNVDYIFDDCLIELKLIEEEGLEKVDRHEKIFELFSTYSKAPVVVLDPNYLSDEDRKKFYRILETPVKTQIKKANSQLKISCERIKKNLTKILIIINNDYQALNQEEFLDIVKKRVKNDTTNIDYVICTGIYFYSDGYEHYVIFPFELIKVRKNDDFLVYDELNKAWNNFLREKMSSFYTELKKKDAKNPISDIAFSYKQITFIKPSPLFEKKSSFFVNGRPRINSSGINTCPVISTVFPQFSLKSWHLLKTILHDECKIKDSYAEWILFSNTEEKNDSTLLKPFVQLELSDDEIIEFIENTDCTFKNLCELATEKYHYRTKKIIDSAKNIKNNIFYFNKFIYFEINEIGKDKNNDLASIYMIHSINGTEVIDIIFENQRIFFEYAICLASAYAIKNKVDIIMYWIDKKYCWA